MEWLAIKGSKRRNLGAKRYLNGFQEALRVNSTGTLTFSNPK